MNQVLVALFRSVVLLLLVPGEKDVAEFQPFSTRGGPSSCLAFREKFERREYTEETNYLLSPPDRVTYWTSGLHNFRKTPRLCYDQNLSFWSMIMLKAILL